MIRAVRSCFGRIPATGLGSWNVRAACCGRKVTHRNKECIEPVNRAWDSATQGPDGENITSVPGSRLQQIFERHQILQRLIDSFQKMRRIVISIPLGTHDSKNFSLPILVFNS
jgi:hypothetical protein